MFTIHRSSSFLGTIVEAGKGIGQMILAFGTSLCVVWGTLAQVTAEFGTRDFAYDWVLHYMDHHRVWQESRSFKVVARNASSRPNSASSLGMDDGHPDPVYEAAPATPSFFRWRGYWISVNKKVAGYSHYDTNEEVGGALSISILGRNRQVLDDFVRTARQFYIDANVLPRRVEVDKEPSGALLTADFPQADLAHDWMLAYLRSANALKENMHFTISTKQSDLGWGSGPKDAVRFMPASDTRQQFLFSSPDTGRKTWIQVVVKPGQLNWSTNTTVGGSIHITLHTSDKAVLADLIECARKKYLEHGISRVTVHLTDNRGEWAKTVSKSRRPMSTLILPTDVKEMILADAREFLESEKWYNQAGIPHRRGWYLYGEPGTGKSSTIHALAGELGLEIYFVSLANPGIDDYTLAKLISDTPSRCILLIEDIDCAFPSRDEDEDAEEEPMLDKDGKPIARSATPPRSNVTLSGLLNVLDSIQYKLADSEQIAQVFKRFFPLPNAATIAEADSVDLESNHIPIVSVQTPYTEAELDTYAAAFANLITSGTYSIAQIQGYLLTKKRDPADAVDGVNGWLKAQEEEKRAMAELKAKPKAERARKLKMARERADAEAGAKLVDVSLNGVGTTDPVELGAGNAVDVPVHSKGVNTNGVGEH
ncbi:P-loop containing nucleoside triphosphate hydrolase protein [Mycena pura]|uniref:P-loop containing nucleoside triphosphate hydrolase protein n=1 Tax=Mycena pura TaxID=153505 RepID=A0AAD6YEF3_9AGAR|nr:P-loop containing nucleoside triphosphate hydrolase protein [Mycena pura]